MIDTLVLYRDGDRNFVPYFPKTLKSITFELINTAIKFSRFYNLMSRDI